MTEAPEDADLGDVLYVATTRPAMKMGVPVEGLVVNAAITYLAFIWLGRANLWLMPASLCIFPVVHFPMRVMTSQDHNLFRIARLWLERGICLRTRQWRGELLAALPHRLPKNHTEISGSV